jgi:Response regulator containing a CheY-like receiver domain and an HD-GYP domain
MTGAEKAIGGSRILIVDDVETNRVILEEIIKDMGCRPILAGSGVEALKLFYEFRPSLVLTDISMPQMDGYELCRALKADPDSREIPVIFISAFDDPKDIVKGFSIGGIDYITKPFIPEVIQSRVGVHVRLYEANREISEANRRLQASVNAQLQQMEEEKKSVLYALANAAAKNSYHAEEYIGRLRYDCRILAQSMQFSPLFESEISDTFIDTIELAAPLCDVGNISIPKDVLQKKEKLSEEEVLLVRSHTDIGARLLADLQVSNDYNDFIRMSIEIAQSHHENWDGTGYPKGLKGNEIPLSAQIVSLANIFCALTEKRSFREEYSREEALAIMKEDAEIKFHPDIFKIFCKVLRQLH